MIVATDENNAIGQDNNLLCRLKDDMRHFVSMTKNKAVVMGSKTFASLGHKPLKNRFNIVLTREPMAMTAEHAELLETHDNLIFESLDYVHFLMDNSEEEFFVIGGEQTYNVFFPRCERVYLTRIHHDFTKADAFFPFFPNPAEWTLTPLSYFPMGAGNDHAFTIFQYDREPSVPVAPRLK